ncbi:uncharacterized protein TRIADDRAFT_57390 [Trichoplax adhaerens]|uniref:SAM domain-containing protein n=1 Tax=Trichoplax adhaerens TaxID=10228 RepID=B3RZB3_TRIAD|nr:hypothetical protein TRIADDRAFT_57390 [Trichoplax adhaerens]EDV24173.1 hypothetical protein TRIADDRAFT_57390 [Trichoplax adhaerens]|eukprot:XP_002113699.1 hypothetical protein TRIADDRAFT_57390 [Trichoplax adhaerens]
MAHIYRKGNDLTANTENVKNVSKKYPIHSKASTVNQMSYKYRRNTSNGKLLKTSRELCTKRSDMTIFDAVNDEDTRARKFPVNVMHSSISNESINTDQLDTTWLSSSPYSWNSQQVAYFVCTIDGCERYGQLFLNEQVDGEALLLLREEHLISILNLKLGPALKILAKVKKLKSDWANGKIPGLLNDREKQTLL